MAKARALPDLKGKLVKITVELTADEVETLIHIASRYPADMADAEDLRPAIRRCIDGFGGRKAATDKHSGKVQILEAAKKAGTLSQIPEKAKTKRYQPLYPHRAVDAVGTKKEVGTWIRQAPVLKWSTASFKAVAQ